MLLCLGGPRRLIQQLTQQGSTAGTGKAPCGQPAGALGGRWPCRGLQLWNPLCVLFPIPSHGSLCQNALCPALRWEKSSSLVQTETQAFLLIPASLDGPRTRSVLLLPSTGWINGRTVPPPSAPLTPACPLPPSWLRPACVDSGSAPSTDPVLCTLEDPRALGRTLVPLAGPSSSPQLSIS